MAVIIFAILFIVLVAIDRITKATAIDVLSSTGSIVFIPGFMDFTLVYNTGGAFGMLEGAGPLFVAFAAIALVAIIVYLFYVKQHNPLLVIALILIAAGAAGNAYDRLVSGSVPDFIHTLFIEFAVFNVADCCLTVGVALITIMIIRSMFKQNETAEHKTANESDKIVVNNKSSK
jgi:signal peptidase II